jgi:exosome complex component MTR3
MMTQALENSLILEKFPKSVLDVYVMVIESDGGSFGAAITSASLAIASAGIEMFDIVTACSVAIVVS